MARVKVQDKYRAIMDAAVSVFAEQGFWDTPTSLISRTAGVADGTLFNYFKTKDDLINEVYLDIKRELIHELMDGIGAYETVQDKLRHVWNQYIQWGVQHTERFKVVQQIGGSYELSEAVRVETEAHFAALEQLTAESIAHGEFMDYPIDYVVALVESTAVATIQFASMNREKLADYQRIGFSILWNGITR